LAVALPPAEPLPRLSEPPAPPPLETLTDKVPTLVVVAAAAAVPPAAEVPLLELPPPPPWRPS